MSAAVLDAAPAPQPVAARPSLAVALLALFASLMAAAVVLGTQRAHGIEQLQLEAPLVRVPAEQVRRALEDALDYGLFGVDLQGARTALERLPWVSRARVERVWPATLRVRIWERQPQARWGARRLLDADGVAFTPAAQDLADTLPQLDGPSGRERQVLDRFQHLQQRLRGTRFELAGLRQDLRSEWFARTGGGIELRLGRGAPEAQVALLLGPVARAIADHLDDVAHIDLRYTNGFAVALREPHKTIKGEKHG